MEPDLLTVDEAAALLRLTRNTVYEAVNRGDIPAIRIGRTIRIDRHVLLAHATERKSVLPSDRSNSHRDR